MEEAVKLLLSKLDGIDKRLKSLETPAALSVKADAETVVRVKLDPLFKKAVELVESDDHDEFTLEYMKKILNVDSKRAEKIMDQLADAGYGTCYIGEVN